MTWARVALLPRDGFFCKDGRGWFTSASGRGHGLGWPWPSTVLGALRTAWGRAEEDRARVCFGPSNWKTRTASIGLGRMLALRRPHGEQWAAEHVVWPAPRDAVWFEGNQQIERLDPRPPELPTLGRDEDAARQALWRPSLPGTDKPGKLPQWWGHTDLVAWLAGRPVRPPGRNALGLARRLQTHVGIRDEELTADEGVLFSHDVVETLERRAEWAIGVEVSLTEGALPATAVIGSDARPLRVEPLPEALFDPPRELLEAFRAGSAGVRLMLVTPGCFQKGWLPEGLTAQGHQYRGPVTGLGEVVLRAALVPRPLPVSGWDMALGVAKSTVRTVAPGAVFFFERVDGRPFGEADARALWLFSLGAKAEEGYGRVVPGVWNPTRSSP